jgi:dTMP kinase
MTSGILVVFEGINGAGKSTIIEKLIEMYQNSSVSISVYKFPNRYGKEGARIDRYLKGIDPIMSKYAVLDMFASDRESARELIMSDLANGFLVVCDRYVYSAIAYQMPLGVYDPHLIYSYCKVIGHFDKKMPTPDITYVIDGRHLYKRAGSGKEIFHYGDARANQLFDALLAVVAFRNLPYVVVSNKDGEIGNITTFISQDIESRWRLEYSI